MVIKLGVAAAAQLSGSVLGKAFISCMQDLPAGPTPKHPQKQVTGDPHGIEVQQGHQLIAPAWDAIRWFERADISVRVVDVARSNPNAHFPPRSCRWEAAVYGRSHHHQTGSNSRAVNWLHDELHLRAGAGPAKPYLRIRVNKAGRAWTEAFAQSQCAEERCGGTGLPCGGCSGGWPLPPCSGLCSCPFWCSG